MNDLNMADVIKGLQEDMVNEIVEYCFHDTTLDEAGELEVDTDYIFVSRKELAASITRALQQPKED